MERVRHRRRQDPPVAPQDPTPEAPQPGAEGRDATVRVQWGSLINHLDVQGMTVRQVWGLLREHLDLPAGVTAYVDGEQARSDRILRSNESLEFVRLAAEKGAAWA